MHASDARCDILTVSMHCATSILYKSNAMLQRHALHYLTQLWKPGVRHMITRDTWSLCVAECQQKTVKVALTLQVDELAKTRHIQLRK